MAKCKKAQVGHAGVFFMVRAYAHSIPTRREELAKLTDEIMGEKVESNSSIIINN